MEGSNTLIVLGSSTQSIWALYVQRKSCLNIIAREVGLREAELKHGKGAIILLTDFFRSLVSAVWADKSKFSLAWQDEAVQTGRLTQTHYGRTTLSGCENLAKEKR